MTVALAPCADTSAAIDTGDGAALLSLRDRVADIARDVEAPFVTAGARLMEVVESLDKIIAELDGVSKAIDRPAASASVADLQRVADRLLALPDVHAARTAQMNDVADAAKALSGAIAAAGRTIRILDIFGMNIGIASEGEPEFTGFVRNMSEKLAEGERDLAAMAARLGHLSQSIAGMRGAERDLLAESARVIPQVPRRLIRDATALGDHLDASAAAADQVAITARRVRDQIAVILGAMQVGDSTRQRLEHIAAGLDMAATCRAGGGTPAAAAQIERLLSAQIDATATDFDADALLLADAFVALQPDTQRLLALMDERTGAGSARAIAEVEGGIGEVMRLTTRLCGADDRARAMAGVIADAIADLGRRLDGVRRLRSNVQVIATNIALMCRRHGQIGRGVSAIADQIDVQAAALPQVTENIARPIAALVTVSEAMQRQQDESAAVDAATILSGAMAILSEGARRSEAASQHRRGDDGRRLIEILGSVAGRIERTLGARIRDCALPFAAPSPSDIEPSEDDLIALMPMLHNLGALYTMAQERAIHARFLPPGAEPVAAAAAPDDEDDDGLF